jgi:electron-transferring-flavoprotein dehydrogenase
LKGGRLRSWGAKSLQESGKRGEPFLAGDGYARIGEGSGSTNVLTGSGVDEAWTTGIATGRSGARTAANRQAASPARTWSGPTWRGAARAGWKRKGASPKRRATASIAAWSPD